MVTAAGERGDLSDAALSVALEAVTDGAVLVDGDGRIVLTNPAFCTRFGYAAADLAGRTLDDLVAPGADGTDGTDGERLARHHDGHELPVELAATAVPGRDRTVVVVRDLTEGRRAADELTWAQQQLARFDDRERIARDLHDTVIQRLFAVGLSLQGALARAERADLPEVVERVEFAIEEVDGTIRDVRTAIISLQSRRRASTAPRDTVLRVAREAAPDLGFEPRVAFEGLVDTAMPDLVRAELEPTLREALTNVARHASATRVEVCVAIADDVLVRVSDNGVGVDGERVREPGPGLADLHARAAALGGTCAMRPGERGGAVLEWRVPLA